MIRHVFMLIWNRKRANLLIMFELLVTFLILFALSGFTLNLYRLYTSPLGFNADDIWSVTITTGGRWNATDDAAFPQVLAVVEQLEEVTAAELMYDLPFELGGSAMSVSLGNLQGDVDMNAVSTGFPQALGMQLVEGRWFGPEDENQSQAITPVIVNKAFSAAAGGTVVGALIPQGNRQQRIVGVFEEFRQHGQFSRAGPFLLQQVRIAGNHYEAPIPVLILKPGITAEFEEHLLAVLQRAAPDWDFDVNSWATLQQNHFKLYTIPLMIVSGLVLFLLLMVGFGLLGVLWQNIIRRTPEMGVRRALGASAGAVRLQVVLELLAVAVFTLVIGIAIVVQLPLAGIIAALDWPLFISAATLSTLVLLMLCILFALYPSYQATRKDPVDALRYE